MEYLISNLDCINALEDGRMMIFLKDGNKIETDQIDFYTADGIFTTGFVYKQY